MREFAIANVEMSGGWRRQFGIAALLVAAVAILAIVSYRLSDPSDHGYVSGVWLSIVTGVQCLLLLLLCPGAVKRAVQRDFTNGMLESHRITPMSNLRIVFGYLFGAPVTLANLYVASLLTGSYFAIAVGSQTGMGLLVLRGWYALQPCLLMTAFLCTTLMLLNAISSRGKAGFMTILAVLSVFVGWFAICFVPGLALVTGVLTGDVLFGLIRTTTTTTASPLITVLTIAAQAALGATFIAAACRKVRAPHLPAFSIQLGLILALAWAATLVVGAAVMPARTWLRLDMAEYLATIRIIASVATFLLLALFAIVAAAAHVTYHDRLASFGFVSSWRDRVGPMGVPLLVALLALATFFAVYWVTDPALVARDFYLTQALHSPQSIGAMCLAILLSAWTSFCVLYWLLGRNPRGAVAGVTLVIGLLAGPLVAELLIAGVADAANVEWSFAEGYIAGISPVGTLILCCTQGGLPWSGLAAQLALAALATVLALRVRARNSQPPPMANPLAAAATAGVDPLGGAQPSSSYPEGEAS